MGAGAGCTAQERTLPTTTLAFLFDNIFDDFVTLFRLFFKFLLPRPPSMIRCADTVKAKPRRVFSQKSSDIHNVPTGGYSSLWNQDIKLVQMQLCTRADSPPQASQVFCVLFALIKYSMSRFEKIIVTNRLVMGISVVYCTFLIVQFLVVKKKKFKNVLLLSVSFFGYKVWKWRWPAQELFQCAENDCSLLKERSVLKTCRILKEVF